MRKIDYVDAYFFERWKKAKESKSTTPIKGTRNSVILEQFIGFTFQIHNGRVWLNVFVESNMVGHKFGEFVPTRTFKQHGNAKTVKAMRGGK